MNQLVEKINKVQVTRAVANCLKCGLPELVCMCRALENLKYDTQVNIKLHVIMHEKELGRSTNTARLLDPIFPGQVSYYVWQRKEPAQELLRLIQSGDDVVLLLYPSEEKEKNIHAQDLVSLKAWKSKNIHMLVLDGTWQETRKIFNKSPYLHDLLRVEMQVHAPSKFTLRRNQKKGNLCTSEAVALALTQCGQGEAGSKLMQATELFLTRYEIGRGGHGL